MELALVASDPVSSTVFHSPLRDGSSIGMDVIDGVANIVCRNQQGCRSAPCLNGGTCVDRTAGSFTCNCPDGFTGPRCERRCGALVDLVIALDVSGSTRRERLFAILA